MDDDAVKPTPQETAPPETAPPEQDTPPETAPPEQTTPPAPEQRRAVAVGQPGKVMRIGTMIRHLLEEVRSAPLDLDARERLVAIHEASVHELESALSPELAEELRRITLPLADDDDEPPTDAELRIAQAQLVGWLEGLFHGIQAAIAAQQQIQAAQAAAQAHQLPAGPGQAGPGQLPGQQLPGQQPGVPEPDSRPHPGQYL